MEQGEIVDNDYKVREGFRPRSHHLLVRWLDRRETKGGILIPQNRHRSGIMKGVILAMGHDCDPRLEVGLTIMFGGFTEKEFVGPESPADRDPVFFMHEDWGGNGGAMGIVRGEKGSRSLELLNGLVQVVPDLAPAESGGILRPDREISAHEEKLHTGTVVGLDKEAVYDFGMGAHVHYRRNTAEEVKIGDFDADASHIVQAEAIEAVEEREAANV